MKRIFLLSLLCCFTLPILYGQDYNPDFYPVAFTYPKTGQNQLEEDNAYLLLLKPDGTGSDWIPDRRYISDKAPNTPYKGSYITSSWIKNEWKDILLYKSDFVLDTQNRIYIAFVDDRYSPSKKKYVFDYNAQSKVSRIECYASRRDTLNNYQLQFIGFFQYDQIGNQIKDSVIDYSSGIQQRVTYYHYIGNNLIEADQFNINTGDSIDKIVYTYSGNLNTSYSYLVWDTVNSEWALTLSDTFEYNAQQQLIKRVSARTGVDLGDGAYRPRWQETYQYTDQNKLREFVISDWAFPGWRAYTKTEIAYSSSGRPEVGFEYQPQNGGWSTIASVKYLFEVQTGLKTVFDPLSEIVIAPNPANDIITIDLDKLNASVKLYDVTGKLVYEHGASGNHQIDISAFTNGLYYAIIQSEEFQRTAKIIVSH